MKAMAPVFDMFNHDPSSSTVHGFQESNQVRSLRRETASVGELSPRVSRERYKLCQAVDLYCCCAHVPHPHSLASLTMPPINSKSRTLAFCWYVRVVSPSRDPARLGRG